MRRRAVILRDAHHEAGHAAVALTLGHPVASVRVVPEGRDVLGGRTQVFYGFGVPSARDRADRMIELLAGDVAEGRYLREQGLDNWSHGARHVMEVAQALGLWDAGDTEGRVRRLLDEAGAYVHACWADIGRMAALISRPPYALYQLTPDWLSADGLPDGCAASGQTLAGGMRQ